MSAHAEKALRWVLKERRPLNDHVSLFVLEGQEPQLFTYQPGQFCQLFVPDEGKRLIRSYSIANAPGSPRLALVVGYVPRGKASHYLFGLKEGDPLEGAGFFGRLLLPNTLNRLQRLFLIGTGTGVAPFASMLFQLDLWLSHTQNTTQVIVLQGQRTQGHLLFHQEFSRMAEKHKHFHYHPCLSRETVPSCYRGYVQERLKDCKLRPMGDMLYVCGNPIMIDTVVEHATTCGMSSYHIKREKFFSKRQKS